MFSLLQRSAQEYVLVAQNEARVEVFRRQSGGHWLLSDAVGLEAACRFESLECGLSLADIYGKVAFSAVDPIASVRPTT